MKLLVKETLSKGVGTAGKVGPPSLDTAAVLEGEALALALTLALTLGFDDAELAAMLLAAAGGSLCLADVDVDVDADVDAAADRHSLTFSLGDLRISAAAPPLPTCGLASTV